VKARADGSYLLHVRLPKSGQKEGEFLDVFPFEQHGCCPVAALRRLAEMRSSAGPVQQSDPVFTFATGKYLSMGGLNTILSQLLNDVVDWTRDTISCHSFRAGVPSALSKFPDLMTSRVGGAGLVRPISATLGSRSTRNAQFLKRLSQP
jgi:hypothetical protein